MSAKLNSCHITNILHASAQLISSEAVSLRILLERTLEHVFGRTSQTLLAAGFDLKSKPLAEEVQGVNDQTQMTQGRYCVASKPFQSVICFPFPIAPGEGLPTKDLDCGVLVCFGGDW